VSSRPGLGLNLRAPRGHRAVALVLLFCKPVALVLNTKSLDGRACHLLCDHDTKIVPSLNCRKIAGEGLNVLVVGVCSKFLCVIYD